MIYDVMLCILCKKYKTIFYLTNIKNHFEKYLQKTNDNIAISLIKIFKLGPDVSFKGSPIVSPITAALWIYDPFLTIFPY